MFVWNVDPSLFYLPDWLLNGRGIRYYGVLYVMVFLGGYWLWERQMLKGGRTKEQAERFFTMGFLSVLIGARLGHCLFYEADVYLKNPIRILYFWEGGLASHGATISLILILIYFAKKEGMLIREVLDRFSLSAAWGAALIRLGNFFNSEIVGRKTTDAYGVKFPRFEFTHGNVARVPCEKECSLAGDACAEVPLRTAEGVQNLCLSLQNVPWRHASQLYEFFMGFFVFFVVWLVDKKYGEDRPVGLMGFTFLFTYFVGRFTVEFVKEFQTQQERFTMGQYLSIPFIIMGAVGIYYVLKNPVPTRSIVNPKAEN